MEKQQICYLDRMPDEILIQILSYLKSADIISVSNVSTDFESISHSRELTRIVDIYLEYTFKPSHIDGFLTKQPRPSIMTSLNMNCLYWLHPKLLRQALPRLEALEELYILDTKLGFSMSDIVVYNKLPKLKRIALTMLGVKIPPEALSSFPKVTHLCLHVYTKSEEVLYRAVQLIQRLHTLEILILAEPTIYMMNRARTSLIYETLAKSLRKVTCQLYNIRSLSKNINYPNMKQYHWNKRDGVQLIAEILGEKEYSKAAKVNLMQNKMWNSAANFFKDSMPFSVPDSRKLELGEETLEKIYYDDLNIAHIYSDCKRFKLPVVQMLFSENTTKLKRLATNYCMIQNRTIEQKNSAKKRKLSLDINILSTISEHCRHLEELELWACEQFFDNVTDDVLSDIKYLKNLRKLTVDKFPVASTGKCFVEICKGCERLSSLRIKSTSTNVQLNNFICLALPHAKSLTQLRFEVLADLPTDRIVESLPWKLQRVLLKSSNVTSLSEKLLHDLLNEREQLKFLCILIQDLPKSRLKRICYNLRARWKDSDKIIVVDNFLKNCVDRCVQIPTVYVHENVKCKSRVSVLDLFRFDWE